jgi:hypothetical protein
MSQNDEISQFQKQHPEISFISQERLNSFSHEEINLLANNYIVFEGKIKLSDISKYTSNSTNKSNNPDPIEGTDTSSDVLNQIKYWLSAHPNLKIVKHSEFEAESIANQNEYINDHCLILIGETITFLDIELYPY